LIGAGAAGKAVAEVYYENDHYVGTGYNIWYICNGEWHLLSDTFKAPLEFKTEEAAKDYQRIAGLIDYDYYLGLLRGTARGSYNDVPSVPPNTEGLTHILSAPSEIHDFSYLRLTDMEALDALERAINAGSLPPEICPDLLSIYKAKHGGEQADIWCKICKIKKEFAIRIEQSSEIESLMMNIYASDSYHTTLARLHTFRPAKAHLV